MVSFLQENDKKDTVTSDEEMSRLEAKLVKAKKKRDKLSKRLNKRCAKLEGIKKEVKNFWVKVGLFKNQLKASKDACPRTKSYVKATKEKYKVLLVEKEQNHHREVEVEKGALLPPKSSRGGSNSFEILLLLLGWKLGFIGFPTTARRIESS
ncbi:hypothetical protein Ancab_016202 [Ancistrocladus abbreviatus]